jgi:hypothetical protein
VVLKEIVMAATIVENRVVLSRRARFGFGWTNSVEQTGAGLAVVAPREEVTNLGYRQVDDLFLEKRRENHGNEWRYAVFYQGRKILNWKEVKDHFNYGGDRATALLAEVDDSTNQNG